MSQYRNGIINSTTALISSGVTLALGFVPDKFNVYNYTKWTSASGVNYSLFLKGVTANGYAMIETVGVPSTITTNGFTPVVLGADWQNTNYVITSITNANPAVVTVSSLTPTNSLTLANGFTFTISGVVGMPQVNTNRYVVAQLGVPSSSSTKFYLYDTFGNPVDTTGFGTYVSGGNMDVISTPPTAPVLNPVNGQVITPAAPAGLQYDIGYEGITLGSGVLGSNGDVLFWEAWTVTPTGY